MIVQIKRILLLLGIFCLPVQTVFSQHTSNNNYTGAWETPTSWSSTWPVPQTNVNNLDITINGYITENGPLSFSGTCVLTINDTLVIKGDLSLANNCDFTINDSAILIVRGNLTIDKHVEMIANGYLIITGNIIKGGPNGEGSLNSNYDPVKVFVGGTIPLGLTDDNHKYPALDCTSPPTTPYPHSGCSYGDMTDIITDPIYPFFQSTCTTVTLTSSDADNSFCTGTSVTFTASGGTNYNFRVNGTSVQNGGSTTYTTTTLTNGKIVDVIVTSTGGCTNTATTTVTVNENPIAIAGPDQELKFVFETQMKAELSSSETGEWSLISGSGHISDIHSPITRVTELSNGENIFLWKVWNGNCEAKAEVKITVHDLFVPSVITPDGDGKNDFFKISEIIGQVELIIFNRWGNEEYTNSNYINDWDGRNNNGEVLPNDTYFYVLIFENGKMKRGSVLIIR